MDPSTVRSLAAIFSSLLSQTLVILLLPGGASAAAAPSLLLHFLSSTAAAAGCRKRKRSSDPDPVASDPESDLYEAHAPSVASFPCELAAAAPDQFRLCFRMTSSSFEWLSGLLEPLLDSGPEIRPSARLAVGLFRLASGCPYADVARMFNISESAARFCTKRLCRVLCTNFRFWLAFPVSESDIRAVSDAFEAIPGGLPGCCGAIVSTRFSTCGKVPVFAQVVAEPNCRILNISTGYGGRKGGSWMGLRGSSLYRDVEDGKLLGQGRYLVGGDGYPLLPWMMVRFSNGESGLKEAAFNEVHGCMLRPASRTVRSLMSWGVLGREMVDEERRTAVACIGTCAILHNMLLMREDYSALSSEVRDDCFVDHGSGGWCEEDAGFGESKGAKEAADLRSTLAEKARELRDSSRSAGIQ